MVNSNHIGYFLSSSLWITVLIVRVGCIIEAHASSIEGGLEQQTNKDSKEDLQATLLRHSGVKKKITLSRKLHVLRNLSSSTSTSTTTARVIISPQVEEDHHPNLDVDDDGTCERKMDGYFPNYGSDCTSYYFCAAGFQITYVCPPDTRFNEQSKKCEDDTKCMSKGHKNLCNGRSNGYYANVANTHKYYYCHNNAKVIDLLCDVGKIFDGNKCIFQHEGDTKGGEDERRQLETISCEGKTNGFYPILNSGCKKYYFCIGGDKTELKCDSGSGKVFNGDTCVLPSQYNCPFPTNLSENNIVSNGNTNSNSNVSARHEGSRNNLRRKDRAEESFSMTMTSESVTESLGSTSAPIPTTMLM